MRIRPARRRPLTKRPATNRSATAATRKLRARRPATASAARKWCAPARPGREELLLLLLLLLTECPQTQDMALESSQAAAQALTGFNMLTTKFAKLTTKFAKLEADVGANVKTQLASLNQSVAKNGAAIGALAVFVDADKGEKAPACAAGTSGQRLSERFGKGTEQALSTCALDAGKWDWRHLRTGSSAVGRFLVATGKKTATVVYVAAWESGVGTIYLSNGADVALVGPPTGARPVISGTMFEMKSNSKMSAKNLQVRCLRLPACLPCVEADPA